MPGAFTSDMAVITSMSWQKGGDENLFSVDGLPLELTVNITVKDLYPILTIASRYSLLRANIGMVGFLDNMAGLGVERFDPVNRFMQNLTAKWNYNFSGVGRLALNVKESFKDKVYKLFNIK